MLETYVLMDSPPRGRRGNMQKAAALPFGGEKEDLRGEKEKKYRFSAKSEKTGGKGSPPDFRRWRW